MNRKIVKTIESKVLTIPESKIFTYPTRLNDSWSPGILEIKRPSYDHLQPELECAVEYGVTDTTKFTNNKITRLYKKIVPPLKIDKDIIAFDSRYVYEGNMAHLLMTICHIPLQLKRDFSNITIIFPAKAHPLGKKVAQHLDLPFITTDKEVEGNLVRLSNYKFCGIIYENAVATYKNRLFEGYNPNTPERIFISRKGARSLINEKEIEELLEKYGFKKYYFEDIPLPEQWSLCKNAKVVVGIHGAALSCLEFNDNPVKLIELYHPGYIVTCYRKLTAALRGSWSAVIGEIDNEYKEGDLNKNPRMLANAPTKIDLNSLIMALEYMEITPKY